TSNFDGVDNVYLVYDTGIREYYGIELLRFIQLLEVATQIGDLSVLNGLKTVKKVSTIRDDLQFKIGKAKYL
ncbi:MAG: hypothetical protein QXH41_06705, partial [Metallosphaera sp.]